MNQEIVENIEDNDLIDPIGDLRRALNEEVISKERFNKIISVLKVLPEFLNITENKLR